MMHQL